MSYINAQPGVYYPRIYRPGTPWPNSLADMVAPRAVRSSLGLLANRLSAIFAVVEPVASNAEAFGHDIRQGLILACTEVEAGWAGVLRANKYPRPPHKWNTSDYVKTLAPLCLEQYTVSLFHSRDFVDLAPFRVWDPANPTPTLPWYHAYNQTKHDREIHFDQATLGHLVHAFGAALVLAVAQYGKIPFGSADHFGQTLMWAKAPNLQLDAYRAPPDGADWVQASYPWSSPESCVEAEEAPRRHR